VSTLGEVEERGAVDDATAVVVDRVGVLAQLYTVGAVAYVGGGFGSDGLHSVLEPAAAGVPVAFGPHHANARAATDLLREGGGAEVQDPGSLSSALGRWLVDADARMSASEAARGYILRHRGAALRCAESLSSLMPSA
jgi:3-deoxy-D-manno-octulosonic-acid transferase